MDEKPIERVRRIIANQGLSVASFEKMIGMSNNSIQAALKRKTSLKDETLNNILSAFPDISAEWLLTGNGDMKKSPDQVAEHYDADAYIVTLQREHIILLKEENVHLKHEITTLKKELSGLRKQNN